jgi:hypothetical protein
MSSAGVIVCIIVLVAACFYFGGFGGSEDTVNIAAISQTDTSSSVNNSIPNTGDFSRGNRR